jgi:hypothetical protein
MENDMKDPDLAEKLKDSVMTKNDLLCIEIAGLCHDIDPKTIELFRLFYLLINSVPDKGYSRNASYLMKVIPETHRT